MSTTPDVTPRPRPQTILASVLLAALVLAGAAFVLAPRIAGDDEPTTTAPSANAPEAAIAAMIDGRDYFVGTNLDPGVYRQAGETPDCRWQVTAAGTGEVIEQGTPGAGVVTVNLGPDTKFRAEGCGPWVAVP